MEHHPDRKGVSTRAGTLQFQEIQEAYTHINKLRRLQQMAHAAAARAAEQAPSTNPAATQSAQEAATKGVAVLLETTLNFQTGSCIQTNTKSSPALFQGHNNWPRNQVL